MSIEDLLSRPPYEQRGAARLGHRRRHLIGILDQTASPLNEFVDNANRMIDADDGTEPRRPASPGVIEIFVVAPADDDAPVTPEVEQSDEPGAPSASLLFVAAKELSAWLSLTQQQVAGLVGISSSTIMAWRRSPGTHPRHAKIPTLLRLWAAVAGARDEIGEAATLQIAWGSSGRSARGAIKAGAEELTEKLIEAAEAASLAAFSDTAAYEPDSVSRPSAGQLAQDEESLSRSLRRYAADSGESSIE